MPEFWSNLANTLWYALLIVVFITYLMALFSIITDLFRDKELNGFVKAIWLIALIFFPFITALAYLIFRGGGMNKRAMAQAQAQKDATDAYIRTVSSGPAEQIAQAKALLDAGTINVEEFNAIKAKALA